MRTTLTIVLMVLGSAIFAQTSPFKVLTEKEVNFLFDYYEQDGNHSPVTGGVGTEKLDCIAPSTSINIPFDTIHSLSVNIGMDYYSSASSNRIDRFVTSASSMYLSSASSQDVRVHLDATYTLENPVKKSSKGLMLGFSAEFDVTSFSGGLHYTKSDMDENMQFGIGATVYYDAWKLIYPGEVRDGVSYSFGNDDSDHRVTSTLTLSYAQVLTRKLQMFLTTDIVYQSGILNTPFHRVYFDDGLEIDNPGTNDLLIAKTMKIEHLPRSRLKIPVGLRLNYYLSDRITTRLFYRYYSDDFGINAHTFSVELPVKVAPWLTVYPLYRYHHQTASKYFAPFGEHPLDENFLPSETYYTSDYDLSGFSNNKVGGGFRISPTYGLKKWNFSQRTNLTFKSIEFRYAYYNRSDGLTANTYSFALSFVF
ncbi:MAG: DUF3570 domain-containing protein [Bacteroidales bacterium]